MLGLVEASASHKEGLPADETARHRKTTSGKFLTADPTSTLDALPKGAMSTAKAIEASSVTGRVFLMLLHLLFKGGASL
jgi:hypothetical protein